MSNTTHKLNHENSSKKITHTKYCKLIQLLPNHELNGIYDVENYGVFHWVNGRLHRVDGPACIYQSNQSSNQFYTYLYQWFIEGEYYSTKEEFDKVAYFYINGLQDYL